MARSAVTAWVHFDLMKDNNLDNSIRESHREALERLLEGNRRFVEGRSEHPRTDANRRVLLHAGQEPFAAIVGCADSRVPVEIVFDQGLGDLFSVRVAGNVATQAVIGSIEYAVTVLGVKLVAVLGHERCGAVQEALEGVGATEPLEVILNEIRPAVTEARERGGSLVDATVRIHAVNVARALVDRSDTLRSRVESGSLTIVPLLYELDSGRVERLR
ncbi:MAG: carbonic anhydrase [Candidatus Latescibacterota bacterium]|nr:MAG: carbonic anhydrase [Candidatus Latescibacterota bacterium]